MVATLLIYGNHDNFVSLEEEMCMQEVNDIDDMIAVSRYFYQKMFRIRNKLFQFILQQCIGNIKVAQYSNAHK